MFARAMLGMQRATRCARAATAAVSSASPALLGVCPALLGMQAAGAQSHVRWSTSQCGEWNPFLSGAVAAAAADAGAQSHVRWSTSQSGERLGEKWRRPAAGTAGACAESGIRFYASRSRKADESAHCFAIAEQLHQFAVVDGVAAQGSDEGAASARFCAGRLAPTVARVFAERVRHVPLQAATRADGSLIGDEAEAVAAVWAEALSAGFAVCDQQAQQAENIEGGACGALLCAVAQSGIYIASVGLGRVVVGTEVGGGEVVCDEASSPHSAESEAEAERFAEANRELRHPLGAQAPTRLLGGSSLKMAEPLLVASPDVVRHEHAESRRFIVMGSPGLWDLGARLPVQWAIEAYKAGRNPADELVARSRGGDVVALVLVLPQGLGADDGRLPPHDELVTR